MSVKVAFIGGSWSSNIGNAFYNLGTKALLNSIPEVEAYFIPDPPHWKEMVKNDFNLITALDVDFVVLTGPCLNHRLEPIFDHTFHILRQKGIKIGFLSAGMSMYEEGEAEHVSKFLNKHQINFLFTRDSETYNFYKERLPYTNVYDGLCNSMFLNDAVSLAKLNIGDYYVFNFDQKSEPKITIKNDTVLVKSKKNMFFSSSQKKINDIPIIRTNNNSIDSGYKNIYNQENTYHSDLPWGYLTLLANAKGVFSERVHTCAATLILGGQAHFIPVAERSFEKRYNLFNRIGLPEINKKPCSLDMEYINKEKDLLKTALKEQLFK